MLETRPKVRNAQALNLVGGGVMPTVVSYREPQCALYLSAFLSDMKCCSQVWIVKLSVNQKQL